MDKIGNDFGAVRRVNNFRVEQNGVKFPGLVGYRGNGRVTAGGSDDKTFWQFDHFIAVAHPDLMTCPFGPYAIKQGAIFGDVDEGPAEFLFLGGAHFATELMTHGLVAVADAQNRDAHFEYLIRGPRGFETGHRIWTTRQDDPGRIKIFEYFCGLVKGHNL